MSKWQFINRFLTVHIPAAAIANGLTPDDNPDLAEELDIFPPADE